MKKTGKKCPDCGKINKQSALNCRVCNKDIEHIFVKNHEIQLDDQITARSQERNNRNNNSKETSGYEAAILVSGLMSFVGWMIILAGVVMFFITIDKNYLNIMPSLGIAVAGLLVWAGAQIQRAIVDTADSTKMFLEELRKITNQ